MKLRFSCHASDTPHGIWDVIYIRTFDESMSDITKAAVTGVVDSGNAGNGYLAANVLSDDMRLWGGRASPRDGTLWIELHVKDSLKVAAVSLTQSSTHYAICYHIHMTNDSGISRIVAAVTSSMASEGVGVNLQTTSSLLGGTTVRAPPNVEQRALKPLVPSSGVIPQVSELTRTPSSPLWIPCHPVSLQAQLAKPRDEAFRPDESFYNAVCVDGIWICASKSVEDVVLLRCRELVERVVPKKFRAEWQRFRSPKGFKDPGPMRIIILDNRTHEQAGCIPELGDDTKGRNCTCCPFVFTSREDLLPTGVGGWSPGRLTLHELVHGFDMVIRQLIDPFFNDEALQCYVLSRHLYQTPRRERLYASTSRDEYVAETLCVAWGMMKNDEMYRAASMSNQEDLQRRDPLVLNMLRKYFNVPVGGLDDLNLNNVQG